MQFDQFWRWKCSTIWDVHVESCIAVASPTLDALWNYISSLNCRPYLPPCTNIHSSRNLIRNLTVLASVDLLDTPYWSIKNRKKKNILACQIIFQDARRHREKTFPPSAFHKLPLPTWPVCLEMMCCQKLQKTSLSYVKVQVLKGTLMKCDHLRLFSHLPLSLPNLLLPSYQPHQPCTSQHQQGVHLSAPTGYPVWGKQWSLETSSNEDLLT